jgi:hypothetical protein
MKKLLVIPFLFAAFSAFSQKAPHLKFKETKHNVGYIQKGDIDTLHYEFTNDGGQPLIFSDFKVDCNCTKAVLPKDPVAPGASGEVLVIFDSKGWAGLQDRKVIILSNAKNHEEILHFKCEVLQKKKLGF